MVAKAKEINGFDKDTIYQDLKKEKTRGCSINLHYHGFNILSSSNGYSKRTRRRL